MVTLTADIWGKNDKIVSSAGEETDPAGLFLVASEPVTVDSLSL